jgi:hypothetical protein
LIGVSWSQHLIFLFIYLNCLADLVICVGVVRIAEVLHRYVFWLSDLYLLV